MTYPETDTALRSRQCRHCLYLDVPFQRGGLENAAPNAIAGSNCRLAERQTADERAAGWKQVTFDGACGPRGRNWVLG